MPWMKYFGFVGSALVLLLFLMNWLVPEPASEPVHASIDRPAIRIRSMETLPERVVFRLRSLHELPYRPHDQRSHLRR
jgi:hypothetical protein